MLGLVKQNLAITLLPARYVQPDPQLHVIPITDGPTRAEYLAWSNFNPSPATQALLASIEYQPDTGTSGHQTPSGERAGV